MKATSPAPSWAMVSLALSMLMPSLDTSIANTGLPSLARSFGAPFAAMQWIVLAYLLAVTSLIVSAGRMGDLFGRRRLLLAGIALFTVASAWCGLAPGLGWLIVARAVQGLGAALMMALTIASVREAVPVEQTGRAMGLLGTMSAVGTMAGPALGGILIAGLGWRSIFLVNLPLGIINWVMARRYLARDHKGAALDWNRFDLPGTGLLVAALASCALAVTWHRWALLGVTLAAGAGFVAVERRVALPLIQLGLFRERGLAASLVMNMLVMSVMVTTMVVGPFYLVQGLGLSTARAGLILSCGPMMAALAGVPAGRIVDRLGAGRVSVAGLGLMLAGAAALALLPTRLGIAGYVLPIMVLSPGYALFQAANNTAMMGGVNPAQRGLVAGLLSLSRNMGLIGGTAAMGAVFAAAARAAGPALGGHICFGTAAGVVGAAILIAVGKLGISQVRNRAERPSLS